MAAHSREVVWLETVGRADVARVGGKNASLGEMIKHLGRRGVRVPGGFATTADAYRSFVAANGLDDILAAELGELCRRPHPTWPRPARPSAAPSCGVNGRRKSPGRSPTPMPNSPGGPAGKLRPSPCSYSVTAEDLPDASFAGQQETFLNIAGDKELLSACRRCLASLFTDRAISYREAKGFDHLKVALSIGVQLMVRSDLAGSGVMFSIDTETGFDKVVLIDAAWGLGETVVQGVVDPDAYQVFKPLLQRRGLKPIVDKKRGEKTVKLIYARGGDRPTRMVSTSLSERQAFVLSRR